MQVRFSLENYLNNYNDLKTFVSKNKGVETKKNTRYIYFEF